MSGLSGGVTAISVGCAIKDGGAWCSPATRGVAITSGSWDPAPVQITGLSSGATAISAGGRHACAVKDGGVWCWGANNLGQLGDEFNDSPVPVPVVPLSSGVSAISAGGDHTCALKDGGVWCWGGNVAGQLGNGTRHIAEPTPGPVPGLLSGVTAIAAGALHTCALKDGGVWCWGSNDYGELGDGTTSLSSLPVPVSGLSADVTAISAGSSNSCAVKLGRAWCWGYDREGELGIGSYVAGVQRVGQEPVALVPFQVPGLASGVSAISVGQVHVCAVKHGGVWCWGGNGFGEDVNFAPVEVSWPSAAPTPEPVPTPPSPPSSLPTHPSEFAGASIVVGTPALKDGKVQVPIIITGSIPMPYVGFVVHLRWDQAVFSSASASRTGTVLKSPICSQPVLDRDGGGATYECVGVDTVATGLLGTFELSPAASGCSPLHLFTFGAPDVGDDRSGTYMEVVLHDNYRETWLTLPTQYMDGTADASGHPC